MMTFKLGLEGDREEEGAWERPFQDEETAESWNCMACSGKGQDDKGSRGMAGCGREDREV